MTEYVNECGRCGSSIHFTECVDCDGAGVMYLGNEEDPDDTGYECPECEGDGFYAFCVSAGDWCQDHPRPGCEHVPSGTIVGVPVEEQQ